MSAKYVSRAFGIKAKHRAIHKIVCELRGRTPNLHFRE